MVLRWYVYRESWELGSWSLIANGRQVSGKAQVGAAVDAESYYSRTFSISHPPSTPPLSAKPSEHRSLLLLVLQWHQHYHCYPASRANSAR
jgi:hypothetical protein